jgi:tol-pal system protein YbgF
MRIFICLISFVFFGIALADEKDADESLTPVYEPEINNIDKRLEKIEKQLNNSALLEMLESLESLKTEINTLRGEIEVQGHTIDQLKQKQRDLYTDLDRRLELSGSNNTSDDPSNDLQVLDTNANQEIINENDTASEQSLVIETTSDIGQNGEINSEEKLINPQEAEKYYRSAFKLLKESQYDQALLAFKSFLKDYPDSAFSSNAQYWIGEANYVMQNYEIAINEYQALLNTYPNSQKISHALLKIGYSYAELSNIADAKKILKEVIRQYPDTTVSRLANERLRKIK